MGTDKTEQIYNFYFADTRAAAKSKHDSTIAGNLAVVREDYGICVRTHGNYATGSYQLVRCRHAMNRAFTTSRSG